MKYFNYSFFPLTMIFLTNTIVYFGDDEFHCTQCAPGIFKLDQSSMSLFAIGLFLYIRETVQNQKRKTSVIRLPKFTTVNMAWKCPQYASFSKEKLVLWGLLFWKPNDRCFPWLILNSFTYIKTTKARESMELLV